MKADLRELPIRRLAFLGVGYMCATYSAQGWVMTLNSQGLNQINEYCLYYLFKQIIS